MRTTVTLDPDVDALLKRLMRRRRLSFKEALNQAVRLGIGPDREDRGFETPTFSMGFDRAVPWDKALRVAAEMEDDELSRRISVRK